MAEVDDLRLHRIERSIKELTTIMQQHGARLNDLRAAMGKQNNLNKQALEMYKEMKTELDTLSKERKRHG
jgi:DNA repair ATPase RecN